MFTCNEEAPVTESGFQGGPQIKNSFDISLKYRGIKYKMTSIMF